MKRRIFYLDQAAPRRSAGVLVVGIVPGAVTGIAVWDAEAQAYVLIDSGSSSEVLALLDLLDAWSEGGTLPGVRSVGLVVIEDARRIPTHTRRDGVRGRRQDRDCRSVIGRDPQSQPGQAVQRLVDGLRARGLPVRLAEPLRGGRWDAATLARVARSVRGPGWTAPTACPAPAGNQPARDAARLVFGTTVRHPDKSGQALETWGVS